MSELLAPIITEMSSIKSPVTILPGNGHNNRDWKNFLRRARRNNYSLPKQALVDHIKKIIPRKKYDYVLEVSLEPCGGRAKYRTWDDIPNESVLCPCGNLTHWLIKYEILDMRKDERNRNT